MSLKIRRLIFYTLIVVFLILTFFIIPYSNGWRFDLSTFSFVRLGGLYLNVEPNGALVKVDKLNFEIKSSFIKSGILIANLFPKTYHVTVQKDGYQSWSKDMLVKPSLVNQIYTVILIPEKSKSELLEKNVSDFFPNSNYLTWKDLDNKLKVNDKTIKGTKFLAWLAGEKLALIYEGVAKKYFVINLAQNNSSLNIDLLFDNLKYQKTIDDKNVINKIIGYPLDKNKLIITTVKNLYILDYSKPSLEIINKGKYTLLGAYGEEVFFTDSSHLYFYNVNNKEIVTLLEEGGLTSIEVSPNNQFLAFSKNNKLILLDRSKNENNLIELIDNSSYFKFSPDSKKIASTYNNKISIFFIGDDYELFNKKLMGSSSFEINSLNSVPPFTWNNNSYYLFVRSGTDLKFLEINDDLPINLKTIDTGVNKYFYNELENSIYTIKNNSLYKITE